MAEHARRLRARPGWNPEAKQDEPGLVERLGELRSDETLERAKLCPDCAELRRRGEDPSALCRDHLAQALGLEP